MLRIWRFFIRLLSSLLILIGPAAVYAGPHVVLDIDWTIVAPVSYNPHANAARTITVQGERYRILDGLEEMISDLHHRGVQVSFYSGGHAARNEQLLRQIKPQGLGGKSLFDIAAKVLSREDLVDRFQGREVPEGARFWERYEKDLTRISGDLSNVILVDDVETFVPLSQRRNVVWLGNVFRHYETFEEAQAARIPGVEARYYPNNRSEWLLDRDRLKAVHHILVTSAEETERGGSFADVVRRHADEPRALHRQHWIRRFSNPVRAIRCFSRQLGIR